MSIPKPQPDADHPAFAGYALNELDAHTKAQLLYQAVDDVGFADSVSYLFGEVLESHPHPNGRFYEPNEIATLSNGKLSQGTVQLLQLHCPEHPRMNISYADLFALSEVFSVGAYLWLDTDLLQTFGDDLNGLHWTRSDG